MNRRDVLKIGSLVAAFGVIAASPFDKALAFDVGANIDGKLYKAASDGRVLVSNNKGKSWHLHTKFGAGYSVLNVFIATDEHLYAKIAHKKVKFHLALTEDKTAWAAETQAAQPKPKA